MKENDSPAAPSQGPPAPSKIRPGFKEWSARNAHREEDLKQWKAGVGHGLRDAWVSVCPESKETVSHWRLEEIMEIDRTGSVMSLDYFGQLRTYDILEIQERVRQLCKEGAAEAKEINEGTLTRLLAEMNLKASVEDVQPVLVQPKKNTQEFFISQIIIDGQTHACPEGFRWHRPKDLGKERAKRDKEKTPAAIFQGVFQPKRKSEFMVRHNGLYTIDLDDVKDIGAAWEKITADASVFAAFVSITGTGLKALVYGPETRTATAYETTYRLIAAMKGKEWAVKAEMDNKTCDCSRLCYLAYDPEIHVNWEAKAVTVKGIAATAQEVEDAKPVEAKKETAHEAGKRKAAKAHCAGFEPLEINWSDAGEVPDLEWKDPKDPKGKGISLAKTLDALRINDPVDYAAWLQRGAALKLGYGDEAFPYFDLWSQQAGDAYKDQDYCRSKWDSFKREEGEHVTTPLSILKEAYTKGWKPSRQPGEDGGDESGGRGGPSIMEHVGMLESVIRPTLCAGDQWFTLANSGVWEHVEELGPYRRICMDNMPPRMRTAKRTQEVMRTFEIAHAVLRSKFKPACMWPKGDYDRDTCYVNCRNAVLQVTEDGAEMLFPAASPGDVCFGSQIMAAYDPKATCPNLEAVIDYAFQSNEADVELLQWWLGYCLYPDLAYRLALVNYGPTTTGKSTVWDYGVRSVIGKAATKGLTLSEICSETGYALQSLEYALVNIGGELDADELVVSSKFKLLVGGEPCPVRAIYGKPFTMEGYICKQIFLTNHMPRFKSGTDAELQRLKFLHWSRKVENVDVSMRNKVMAERDGIFTHWMVPALQRLLGGWKCPEDNKAVRSEFALRNDPIKAFVDECCTLEPGGRAGKDALCRAFKDWVEDNSLSDGLWRKNSFCQMLLSRFAGQITSHRLRENGVRVHIFGGLKLKQVEGADEH